MALFGKSKATNVAVDDGKSSKEKTSGTKAAEVAEEKKAAPKKIAAPSIQTERDLSSVIQKPRITEKAALAIDRNVYTFEVHKDATKNDVRDAVKELYDVTPVKVNIVKKTPRHFVSRMRGRSMMEKGLKKAYVYLKEGDKIDLV